MAQNNPPAFLIPPPVDSQLVPPVAPPIAPPAAPMPEQAPSVPVSTSSISVPPPEPAPAGGPTGQTVAIASIVLLVLVIAFFFIRNMWALRLKANRVSESNAEASAWSLFVALTSMASALVLYFLQQDIVFVGAAFGLAAVCLILTVVTNRR